MHVDLSLLQTLCQNMSVAHHPGSGRGAGSGDANGRASDLYHEGNLTEAELDYQNERDRHAFLSIVVVLIFYSFGIIVAIIMYLKREKEEIVEEKAYDDYMNFRSDPDKRARYFRVQLMINQLNKVQREKERRQCEEEQSGTPLDESRPCGSGNPLRLIDGELDITVTHSESGGSQSPLGVEQTKDDAVQEGTSEKFAADISEYRSEISIYHTHANEGNIPPEDDRRHCSTL